jgi:RNA polymerase sigma-70 factor (ECF subfamily)
MQKETGYKQVRGGMMDILQQQHLLDFAGYVSSEGTLSATAYRDIYEQNRHRIYALAFWMTDNELAAEELMTNTFCRVLAKNDSPTPEEIDRALIAEVRQQMPFGELSLQCSPPDKVLSVRTNTLRIDLERAVVQLPGTERIIFLMHDVERYDHARIARTLGLMEDESRNGLHQARLRLRELLAK